MSKMHKLYALNTMSSSEPLKRSKINILGVDVDDISERAAVAGIIKMACNNIGHYFVATVNSEFVILAKKDRRFADLLKKTDLNLPDGVGVVLAKLILGGKEKSRVTGADLLDKLSEAGADYPLRIGYLGGFSDVAEMAAKRQVQKHPGLKIVYANAGNPAKNADLRLRKAIKAAGRIDILFVAYGMGQQEFWIERNRKGLNVGVFIGVGGALDYAAGIKARAPFFMRKIGCEWLWRLIYEPIRIKRMLVLPIFAVLVFGQFLRKIFGF